jgi:hypothetical protein
MKTTKMKNLTKEAVMFLRRIVTQKILRFYNQSLTRHIGRRKPTSYQLTLPF